MIVTKELPKSRNVPVIGYIPISSDDYINVSKNLTQEHIDNIMFPEVISPLQHKFKSCNERLFHLHSKSIFRLSKLGVLSSIFIYLKDNFPLCES